MVDAAPGEMSEPMLLPAYYRDRIRIDDDCWIWCGPLGDEGAPTAANGAVRRSARRAVYQLANPNRVIRSNQVVTLIRCDDPLCVAPHHSAVKQRGSHLPGLPRTAKWMARKTLGLRAIAPKLTIDKARAVRRRVAAGEMPSVLAVEYGVSKTMIHRIVRGDNWRETLSPLALMAQQAGLL